MRLYFFRAQIIVKTFTLSNGFSYIADFKYFDFETSFSTVEAVYFDTVLDGLMTFGAGHFFDSFLKARDMKVMVTGSDHEWAKSPTDIAFTLLILILMPLDVKFHDGKVFAIVTAFHVSRTVPNHEGK